jgi:hypothetical protein
VLLLTETDRLGVIYSNFNDALPTTVRGKAEVQIVFDFDQMSTTTSSKSKPMYPKHTRYIIIAKENGFKWPMELP